MGLLYLGAELGQPFHIALTGVYLFVKDNAVKAFLIVEQAIGYVQIGIRDETEAVHTALDCLLYTSECGWCGPGLQWSG